MDTIFKFLHSILFTLTLQISKLTKAVVLNSFPHGRFWQFVYKEKAELWWEAPIAGSVCIKFPQSRMKGERHRLRPLSLLFSVSKARTFVVSQLVTNVAFSLYTKTFHSCFIPSFASFD
jgi:hypothetical protein